MSMTKRERCMAAVKGEKPDKIPYSLWSHMPQFDHDADAITEKTYEFYKTYDVDFIKTMNNGMYSIEDFGAVIDYSGQGRHGQAGQHPHRDRRGLDQAHREAPDRGCHCP